MNITNVPSTDKIGYNVAITDQFAVFGTSDNSITTINDGALYIYRIEYSQWNFLSRFTIDAAALNAQFGNAVDISEDYLISGALGSSNNNIDNSGSAYIFYRE